MSMDLKWARSLATGPARHWHAPLAWRWTALLSRCVLGAMGLVILAGIGRSALAGAGPSPGAMAAPPEVKLAAGSAASSSPVASAATPPAAAAPLEAPDGGAAAPPRTEAVGRRATPDDPVILNQAAFEDLRRLPGVGPKRAQAILALRQRLGRFRQVEDLLKVKGIGRSTLKKLRPLVRLDPAAPLASP